MRVAIEVLWSDPCTDDKFSGIHPNLDRDPSNSGKMVKFGKDLVDSFLQINNADYILRAHECVENGY